MALAKNLQGQTFGRLKVLYRNNDKIGAKWGGAHWWCLCICGQHKSILSKELKSGTTLSCGCLRDEKIRLVNLKRPYEHAYNRLLHTASLRNQKVAITYEDFLNFVSQKTCHYCLNHVLWSECRNDKMGGYNIDRKDNTVGYTLNNCVVCCARCNFGKNNIFSYDEWFGMTEFFRRKHGG